MSTTHTVAGAHPNKLTGAAVLSISLMLCSAPAINGALPFMQQAMGTTTAQNELLSTLPSFAVIICIMASSVVERALGMKRTICLGLLLAGCGGVIPLFTASYPLIFASRLALGAGLGLYNSLAVSLINALFEGDERATLLGFRNSTESIGQAALTLIAGLLLSFGWHASFAIYFLAFPIAILFWKLVPEVGASAAAERDAGDAATTADDVRERLNPFVWALAAFAVVQVLNSLCMTVRFPSIATQLMGEGFNASFLLSLMPLLGIFAGFVFGFLNRRMGIKVLWLGLAIYIVSDLLVGFSGNSFPLALLGLMLSGLPGSWCFPYIFNTLGSITGPRTGTLATSLIFIGCNVGNFAAPLYMQGVQTLLGTDALTAPFPVLGAVFALILIGTVASSLRRKAA